MEQALRQQRQLVDGLRGTFYSRRFNPTRDESQPRDGTFSAKAVESIKKANETYGPPVGFTQQPPLPATFTLPKRTLAFRIRESQQDRFIMLRAVQDAIAASGQAIPDSHDAYLKQTLFSARMANRLDNFRKGEMKALTDQMKADGVTLDDLGIYMLAKHAPERNAEMAKRDPDRFKAG